MSNTRSIALLCNNKMALPAMQVMHNAGMLRCIATADTDSEVVALFRSVAKEWGIPHAVITYKGHTQQLQQWVADMQPDRVLVMTFPWRIPQAILQLPKHGFINFHYGLLPEMRGADPVFESIRQRMPVAGTTVHVMNEALDAGDILMRQQMPLPATYTYGMLASQLSQQGAQLCAQLLQAIQQDDMPVPVVQDEAVARYWPKISEAALCIKWATMSSADIIALVQACNPIAKGLPTMINGWKIGVCDVSPVNLQGDASAIAPGTILAIDQQNGLIVCCKGGAGMKLDVVYTAEGVLPGYKLAFFGIVAGMVFRDVAIAKELEVVMV